MSISESIRVFFRSKTMRFQVVCGVLIAAEANLGLIEIYMDGSYGIISFVIVGINVYLRTITTESLKAKHV